MNQSYLRGEIICKSGESCLAQRIISGMAMIYIEDKANKNFMRLAIPGDIIGIESLYEEKSFFNTTALTDVVCKRIEFNSNKFNLLKEAYSQQQKRMLDLAKLRTTSISDRLNYLIDILSFDMKYAAKALDRNQLPSLRDMAFIINLAPETVSRGLTKIYKNKAENLMLVDSK